MMPHGLNLSLIKKIIKFRLLYFIAGVILAVVTTAGHCAPVSLATAQRAAEQQLRQHLALYGHWHGATVPIIGQAEKVGFNGATVAVNFDVLPKGHILVALDDHFSPILLYSSRSGFDCQRVYMPGTIEAWIVPELEHQFQAWQASNGEGALTAEGRAVSSSDIRIQKAWKHYDRYFEDENAADSHAGLVLGSKASVQPAAIAVGPLLTSAWGQEEPYNGMMPDGGCSDGRTLTGCVATAWAQLMHYWRWPDKGMGSHGYDWTGQTLSVNYDDAVPYDWDNMPGLLTSGSTPAQKEAVAQLIYHAAVAADTDFGCDFSSSPIFADDVLDTYFKYDSGMQAHERADGDYADDQWFLLIKNELDADPPRPVVLSIWGGEADTKSLQTVTRAATRI